MLYWLFSVFRVRYVFKPRMEMFRHLIQRMFLSLFFFHNVNLDLLLFPMYIPDWIYGEIIKMDFKCKCKQSHITGTENFTKNKSSLLSSKGMYNRLVYFLCIYCSNCSWKKLSKSCGISWNPLKFWLWICVVTLDQVSSSIYIISLCRWFYDRKVSFYHWRFQV